jgi:hypothetical protein
MAGPIASFTNYQFSPESRDRNEKLGKFHYGDGYNFGLWWVDPAAGKASLEFVHVSGKSLFKTELTT